MLCVRRKDGGCRTIRRERLSYVRRRRGRSVLRLEDCVERDVKKAGEEEDWKKKTRDRGGWKNYHMMR